MVERIDSLPRHIQAIALAAMQRWNDDARHSRDFTIVIKVTGGVEALVIEYQPVLCAVANMTTGEVGYKARVS